MAENFFVEAFIEIPKGDDRRRHLSYDKKEMLDLGPIKDAIPVNNGAMPIAYGFILGTLQYDESSKNPKEKPDEIDVLVYSEKNFKIGDVTKVTPIAILTREDGDHKIMAVDDTVKKRLKEWGDISYEERDLILRYFGYKSPIKSIEGRNAAIDYIKDNRVRRTKK